MKNKIRKAVIATAIAALAIPAAAWAADATDFALAETETEQQNLAWYADHANDINDDNESCREDLVQPVFVPEYDGRVIVRGEIVSAAVISCVDLDLESDAAISGRIWIESRDLYGRWTEFYGRNISGYMTNGVGIEDTMIDYVFPYRSAHLDRPMRVCTQTYNPDPSPALCGTAKLAAIAVATPPSA